MSLTLTSPELQTALKAARHAAEICATVYDSLVEAAAKAGREPVTIADYASQAVINAALHEAFPRDSILAEEHAAEFERVLTPEQRQQVVAFAGRSEPDVKAALDPPDGTSGRTWIIDPIDGTKGFLAKRSYAIAIALLDGDDLVLGVLACPNLSIENPGELAADGVLFYAVRGEGAFREPLAGGNRVNMRVAPTQAHEALVIGSSIESQHTNKSLFDTIADNLPSPEKRIIGLDGQGKYGLVADGRITCYYRLVPDAAYREKVWDHAAGTLIVQEAGGRVTDFTGKPFNFAEGRKLESYFGIVVSNGAVHGALLNAIKQSGWTPPTRA